MMFALAKLIRTQLPINNIFAGQDSSQLSQEVNWSETLVEVKYDLLNQGFAIDDAIDVYPPECTYHTINLKLGSEEHLPTPQMLAYFFSVRV